MTTEIVFATVFWCCLAAVAYVYAGYPLVLWIASKLFGRNPEPSPLGDSKPTVSVLIAAHNEERFLDEKLRNTLDSTYPADRIEIVVASDGSDDGTAAIARRFESQGVRLLDFRERRGKAAVLNASIPELSGEIIVLSDANTLFDANAVERLTRWFLDPKVNVVCGRLVLTDPATGQNVDSLYWRYETFLKKNEARLGALLGANGAIYAVRRSHYVPMPDNTIVDDFVIPLLSKLRHGGRIVYDVAAVAFEETPATIGSEFRRRARIGTGGFQSLGLLWRLFDVRYGWTTFAFVSHKVLRWFAPFLLIAMFVANLLLLEYGIYRWAIAGQTAFYILSCVGAKVRGNGLPYRLLRLANMFTSMNAALLVGFWRWLVKPQRGTWQRTAR